MTAKIQILSNTNYPLSDVLKSELIESTKVQIAVAFLQRTGIDEIYKSLDYALLALKDIENKRKNMKVVEKTAAITRRCMKNIQICGKYSLLPLRFFCSCNNSGYSCNEIKETVLSFIGREQL